ncbi:hypothetical protein H072_5613 [Dactylellina haptotyla CBS 200.50]|uniref:Cyclin N-terminal domain-containing protein n=1 Tax=Dactylellina haptotyla (strain CBS 200.50) TaxID=1284197 RepID=S8BM42_DACHA|nr:hypothetical protein H072_5613 [Dactylellina haptotyla CBS 200.50]
MIEGPYSSLDLSCDGRFMHIAPSFLSTSSSASSCSSPITSSQPSPSSTSPSSFADSPSASSKFLGISDRLSSSTASSQFSYYPSPCTDISAASSITSADLTSPCERFCNDISQTSFGIQQPSKLSKLGIQVALTHSSNLQRQACSAQPLPKEQLQNPRRTRRLLESQDAFAPGSCKESQPCPLPPPSLVRQADRKVNFVDNLVAFSLFALLAFAKDTAAQIVEAIWPSSMIQKPCEPTLGRVLPLRTFIQETLRRSRTSYSTLQVALYYLFVIRPFISLDDAVAPSSDYFHDVRALQCGRRMFLAALILASKYLQDRNYSARAWSKISGLNIPEINANELAFLTTVNWKLHISDQIFDKWTKIVLKCTPTTSIIPAQASVHCGFTTNKWVRVFSRLQTSLDLDALDEVLSDEVSSSSLTEKATGSRAIDARFSGASIAGLNGLTGNSKMNSMAFALCAPTGIHGSCDENMPQRPTQPGDDRLPYRGSRKSSLSVCETVETGDMDFAMVDNPSSLCSSSTVCNTPLSIRAFKIGNVPRTSEKPTIVIDSRQSGQNSVGRPPVLKISPQRENILGGPTGHLGSGRPTPGPAIQEITGKNRKRGNETPVASRHQKKQKDKLGEFATPKASDIAPSGLTPQMRQMSTNFSVSGKKGNGLRMNINPGFGTHGQTIRPGTGQRSMSHVYG